METVQEGKQAISRRSAVKALHCAPTGPAPPPLLCLAVPHLHGRPRATVTPCVKSAAPAPLPLLTPNDNHQPVLSHGVLSKQVTERTDATNGNATGPLGVTDKDARA